MGRREALVASASSGAPKRPLLADHQLDGLARSSLPRAVHAAEVVDEAIQMEAPGIQRVTALLLE
ncbi:MAG: hypothetical protein R3F14_44940 [Polyangiaceae bacterium]